MFYSLFKKYKIPANISTYLGRTLIVVTFICTIVIGGVLIFEQSLYFNRLSKQTREDYINDQKLYIQEIVNNELEYLRLQDEYFKKDTYEKIKSNVNQAYNTAQAIYQKYKGKKSDDEIKSLIITTISSLKFDLGYEEVFISTMDGIGVFYPRHPEFSNRNMIEFKDSNGLPVVLKEIDLLKTTQEGFVDYELTTSKKNNSPDRKITFVKKFEHYNWYFGSKQYLSDYFPKFKEEIAKKISAVRFKHGGYVFMNNINGEPIVMDGAIYKGDLNMLRDKKDPRYEVFLSQKHIAEKNPDGDFFTYKWNKMNETALVEKCSFVKPFEKYNWIVGAGFYLDEIMGSIEAQQETLHKNQQKNIATILVVLIILLAAEAIIIYRFNLRYKSDFDRFFNFFFSLQTSFQRLNVDDFYFNEFKHAAVAANQMVDSRKEIEEKLIEEQKRATESDRLKSAFLANMSHEIRTPMNAIIGFSELLEDHDQEEKDKAIFVKLIRKNGEILLNLINDIIDISKIEANLLTVRKRNLHIEKFITEIQSHYSEIIAARSDKKMKLCIDSNISAGKIISTDELRLRQIIDNLIGNAIKFTNSGTITLEVKETNEKINFAVSDTGIGISKEEQELIFGRFMQIEHGAGKNYGGTGLGLAISKNLVDLLGGKLLVESELGIGSKFYFSLPLN